MATEPPPFPRTSITRFQRDPLPGFALSVLTVGLMAGALLGMSATLALVTPPTVLEQCSGSADYIGCIIELAGMD